MVPYKSYLKTVFFFFLILHMGQESLWAQPGGDAPLEGDPMTGRFSPIYVNPHDQYRREVVEFTGGEHLVEVSASGFRTLSRGPLPCNIVLGSGGEGCISRSPLSEVWSEWPEGTISNQSIFSYLLDSQRGNPFSDFVREWYKSSCAIVYYDKSGKDKLIGTGAYVEGSSWRGFEREEGVVATARHNFEGGSVRLSVSALIEV